MNARMLARVLCAGLLVVSARVSLAQVVYDAVEGGLPLSAGGGVSNFDPYFAQTPEPNAIGTPGLGQGRMWGITAWGDGGVRFGPEWLHPVNLELQFRSLFGGGSAGQQNLRENTYGGGATYTWYHFPRFRPYGKYIISYGTVSFNPEPYPGHPPYSHDSRLTNALGGGLEYRITSHIWVRADYEYQLWGHLLAAPEFMPQGVTVGVMYHLRRPRAH